PDRVMIGEVGLGGELRPVPQLSRRLAEAARLGFRSAIVPKRSLDAADAPPAGIALLPSATVAEAIERTLAP
ncbi:MAG TPA: DNA repair protein RadA, partial [Candidatus Omnitrophota bacterium]|nr:DNA repair protein RadA [Candidatus Omnitrophota bacterium]